MSNSFGRLFRFGTFGESHGAMMGAVIDGCPAQCQIDESVIQQWMERRKPGKSRFTTQRREQDKIEILSGVLPDKEKLITTGTPIGLLLANHDVKSKDYDDIAKKFRPGHADYSYYKKYGIRDHRGGGRSSARETALRVAVGAIAHQILGQNLGTDYQMVAGLVQAGQHIVDKKIEQEFDSWHDVWDNDFHTPDKKLVPTLSKYLDEIRKKGSSVGGMIVVKVRGIPAGLGAPLYGKLSADLASALMGINAVKAVAIGDGMDVAMMEGKENNDEMMMDDNDVKFLSNHAGGILAGISTGQEIVVRMAVKPTSSILIPQKTINTDFQDTDIVTKGRHDPCVAIRAVPIAMAMVAITLLDHFLLARAMG